jgi:hypothetical protein
MSVCKAVRVGQRPRDKPWDEPLHARMRDIANTRAIGETSYVDWIGVSTVQSYLGIRCLFGLDCLALL